ncbi:MAG TPA: hypothetical protein PK883_02095 [Anaerolineaceae bacterium]|nr:hypothetical protein [Anaerolineaceae bacterium]
MAGKYTPLEQYLRNLPNEQNEITLSFAQIEKLIQDTLPRSSKEHSAWWSNEIDGRHVQAHAWMNAGWLAYADQARRLVRFLKKEK